MSDTHHHRGQKDRHSEEDLWVSPFKGEANSSYSKKRSRRLERKRYKQSQTHVIDEHLDEVYEMSINEYYLTDTGECDDNY